MKHCYDVLCIGLVNVNMPVRPVDRAIFDVDLTMVEPIDLMLGGDAMNEAITLTKLGSKVGLIGKIGNDAFGKSLLQMAEDEGVDTQNICIDDSSKTSACVMLINKNGDRNFASHRGANSNLCLKDIDLSILKQTKVVNIGSLFALKSLDGWGTEAILKEAKANDVITCADMMCDTYNVGFEGIKETLSQLDYFIPSYDEAESLTGETEPEKIADKLLAIGVKNVIIKMGTEGCYAKNEQESFFTKSYKVEAIDTTGAGDNFVAGFLHGIVQQWDLKRCITFSNAVGAITVQKIGPTGAVQTMNQVLNFIKGVSTIID